MSSFRLLIVDDSKYISRLLQMKLSKLQWAVAAESNPRDCMKTINKFKPDLILMDIAMPEIDGLTLCNIIKNKTKGFESLVIIVHSGRNTRSDVLNAKRAGAAHYIVKPATIQTIINRIDKEMQKRGRAILGAGDIEKAVASIFTDAMDGAARMEALMKVVKEVKAMPQAVQRTLKVAADQKTGAAELSHVIESDSAISAMVLKKANSAFYGKSQPIVNIKEAIVRIGFTECKNLVLGLSIISHFSKDRKSLGFSRMAFWEHSLAVAVLAKCIARDGSLFDVSYAFVAGLMHDIGKIVLDEYASDDFDKALEIAAQKRVAVGIAEREAIKITHNEIGQSLLERWQFPASIQKVMLYHNNLAEASAAVTKEDLPLTRVVSLANDFAKALGIGFAGDDLLPDCPDELASFARLTGNISAERVAEVQQEIRDFKEFIGIAEDAENEPFSLPKNRSTRVFLVKRKKTVVNHYESYLRRKGLDVVFGDIPQAVQHWKTEPCIVVWDMEAEIEVNAIIEAVQPLPESAPVFLLTTKKIAAAWNDAPPRPAIQAWAKPVPANAWLQRIIEVLEKFPEKSAAPAVDPASGADAAPKK